MNMLTMACQALYPWASVRQAGACCTMQQPASLRAYWCTACRALDEVDAIAQEEETLRQPCAALDAQKALVEATETHLGDAQRLLEQLPGRLEDVEQRDD